MSTPLAASFKRELRARGHALNPVVTIGDKGFTDAVAAELDAALQAHELIKLKLPAMDRTDRDALAEAVVEQSGAARVQSIGRVLLLYRERRDEEDAPAAAPRAGTARDDTRRPGRGRNAGRRR